MKHGKIMWSFEDLYAFFVMDWGYDPYFLKGTHCTVISEQLDTHSISLCGNGKGIFVEVRNFVYFRLFRRNRSNENLDSRFQCGSRLSFSESVSFRNGKV